METGNLSNDVQKIVYEYLPRIIKEQPEIRIALWDMLSDKFAPKEKTEDRFEKLLEQIRVQEEKLLERMRVQEEKSDRKFEQVFKKLEENDRKFERIFKKLEENDKKFKENDKKFEAMLNEIRNVDRRIDRTIGALGARWGLSTEHAFREAIRSVLRDFTDTKVERYLGFDNEGTVFGGPEQVEIDVVIQNGKLCVMEIKSSASKGDVYVFDRKAAFYEKETGKKADRKIIVSPMFEPGAQKVAGNLEIETFTAPEDIR